MRNNKITRSEEIRHEGRYIREEFDEKGKKYRSSKPCEKMKKKDEKYVLRMKWRKKILLQRSLQEIKKKL